MTQSSIQEFLRTVVTGPDDSYFCLCLGNGSGWLKEWYRWPRDIDKIAEHAQRAAPQSNVYFSTYLFRQPQDLKQNVLPTRTVQADLDGANLADLPKPPTVLIETSPGRHQAYWVLKRPLPVEEHEILSRRITYSIPLCDRSGWPVGRKVRLPDTFNHKYLSGPKPVTIVNNEMSGCTYDPEEFDVLPEVPQFVMEHYDQEFLDNPQGVQVNPVILLEAVRDNIPIKVYTQYDTLQTDRSAALWALMLAGFKAGLDRNQVFTLAKGSINNKFATQKYRHEQDLAKDVLRAEYTIKSDATDVKQALRDLQRSVQAAPERHRQGMTLVLNALNQQGVFLKADTGQTWYIDRDVGRPISLSPRSEGLINLLYIRFGLNYTEQDTKFMISALCAHGSETPENVMLGTLSWYDPAANTVLLHTGNKRVLFITKDGVENITDGGRGVLFPWSVSTAAFSPIKPGPDDTVDWGEELFGNGRRGFGSSVHNIVNMPPEQAQALLKVWFLFMLMRNGATARPVLSAFGQPGSGKSTLFRKIYMLLYGSRRAINSITTMDDFDHAVANDPLVVYDNVDTWERWLPDRIALSAATSEVTRRKLWTDSDIVVLRRQAMIALSAHNPQFGREDVADRLLLLTYKRLTHWEAEGVILSAVEQHRNTIWGGIVQDLQTILATPQPTPDEIPQFRIEDFARLGLRIARAIGVEQEFRASVAGVRSSSENFTLEEEGVLVAALVKYAARPTSTTNMLNPAQLWIALEAAADDARVFGRIYRNSVALSKKLSVMLPALSTMFHIERKPGPTGTPVWRITAKDHDTDKET